MKKIWTLGIAAIIVAAAAFIGFTSLSRPAVISATGSPDAFSAERAVKHVEEIAQRPHPPGSAEISRVRDYIASRLDELEIVYEIQNTEIAVLRGSSVIATSVQNIIARIPGTGTGPAILLDAHYDTRAMTPGASDCSSCVATLLETARALLESAPLSNEVILLFTDNEEYGAGLGAEAFVVEYPVAGEIGAVLNFEGLGATGPSILFETGPDSRALVRAWRKSVATPVGQSWFQEIYQLTPIGTDLNRFSDAGVPGLNFGHWAQSTVYHTALDVPQSLDLKSLQQTGSYALELVRHLGNVDLTELKKGDSVYFTLVRGLVVAYPASWALAVSVVAGLLLAGVAVLGVRRGVLKIGGTAKGLLVAFLGAAVSAGSATGIWMGIVQLRSEYQSMFTFRGAVYNGSLYIIAFALLSIVITMLLARFFGRRNSTLDLAFGTTALWWILALATSILFPGFSYLFAWPTICMAVAIGVIVLRTRSRNAFSPVVPLTLGAVPGIALLAPAIYVMYHFAPAPMIGAEVFMIALLCGLIAPFLASIETQRRWLPITVLSVATVGMLVAGNLTAGFSPGRPRPSTVAYLQNEDSRSGAWFATGPQTDRWSASFVGDEPRRISVGELMPIESASDWFPVLATDAPYAELEPPSVEIVGDRTSGDGREVRLRIRSPRRAPVVTVEIEPYSAVQSATIAGRQFKPPESSRALWQMTYFAVPTEGIELVVMLDSEATARLQVSDRTWELIPEVLRLSGVKPRTEGTMPMPNFDYGTVVVKTFSL